MPGQQSQQFLCPAVTDMLYLTVSEMNRRLVSWANCHEHAEYAFQKGATNTYTRANSKCSACTAHNELTKAAILAREAASTVALGRSPVSSLRPTPLSRAAVSLAFSAEICARLAFTSSSSRLLLADADTQAIAASSALSCSFSANRFGVLLPRRAEVRSADRTSSNSAAYLACSASSSARVSSSTASQSLPLLSDICASDNYTTISAEKCSLCAWTGAAPAVPAALSDSVTKCRTDQKSILPRQGPFLSGPFVRVASQKIWSMRSYDSFDWVMTAARSGISKSAAASN